MTTTIEKTTRDWPDVVDERIDEQVWKSLEDAVQMMLASKTEKPTIQIWLNPDIIYAEKSGLGDTAELGRVINVEDPAKEIPDDIKGLQPFLLRNVAEDTVFISPACGMDLEYPDLQAMLYRVFNPLSALKPGTQLIPKKDIGVEI